MEITPNKEQDPSTGEKVDRKRSRAPYIRYTKQQHQLLENLFITCPAPDKDQRALIIRENPILANINDKHMKVWFQNRRFRERQKGVIDSKFMEEQRKIKRLRKENDNMSKRVNQLEIEMEHMRNQGYGVLPTTTRANVNFVGGSSSSQIPIRAGINCSRVVEETKAELISKVNGKYITWVHVPQLKVIKNLPKSISISSVDISSTCSGIATRVHAVVPLEPTKVAGLLKDRQSWYQACWSQNVYKNYQTENGASIELIHTQFYATTTLTCARDFWTLRTTSFSSDGSLTVCEKSVSDFVGAPTSPMPLESIRARMMASGYVVAPCKEGSSVFIVEHMDLEASSVPEIIRPLYESAELLTKNTCFTALQYIGHVATEENFKSRNPYAMCPATVRTLGHNLTRGFNEAINDPLGDRHTLETSDSSCDLYIYVKQGVKDQVDPKYKSVVCIKASLLLENVCPTEVVRLLREHRSEWMHFNFSEHSNALPKFAQYIFPGGNTHNLSPQPVVLGNTGYEDEVVEAIRFDRLGNNTLHNSSEDVFHLQLTNGLEKNNFGVCSEFIFAPSDRVTPGNIALMSSGFRIMSVDTNAGTWTSLSGPHSLLIFAFQFPFETNPQDNMKHMARLYVEHVISTVKNKFLKVPSPTSTTAAHHTCTDIAMGLNINANLGYTSGIAVMMAQSYRSYLGDDFPGLNNQDIDSICSIMEHHAFSILCFSSKSPCGCLYANLRAVQMFETTTANSTSIMLATIFDASNGMSLDDLVPPLLEQGYLIIPSGRIQTVYRTVSQYKAVAWLVATSDVSVHNIAIAFHDWSFDN